MLSIPRSKLVPPEYWELPEEDCYKCGEINNSDEAYFNVGKEQLLCPRCYFDEQDTKGEEYEDS